MKGSGGTWKLQNKKLNGAYINFVSKAPKKMVKVITNNKPETDESHSKLGLCKLGKMILGRG